MPEITNFEHNGLTIEATQAPAPLGPLRSDEVLGWVVTAPDRDPSVPLNVPFRIANQGDAQLLDTTGDEAGTGWHAVSECLKKSKNVHYVVVVEEGIDITETTANIIGGIDPTSGQKLGLSALPNAAEVPTVFACPGYSHQSEVRDAMATIAQRLMSRFVIDAIDDQVSAVVTDSGTIGGEGTGYRRAYMAYQMTAIYSRAALGDVMIAPSVHAMACFGATAAWESPGNQGVLIQDVSRSVDYNILDTTTDGDLLNRNGVSYYARTSLGGFSLIGNRGVTGEFISHIGLEDAIARKLMKAGQKAMAKNLTKSFMEQEVRKINRFAQDLVAQEVIPGAEIYLHPTLNTVSRYKNGSWYIVFDYGRYSPNEHTIIHLNASDEITETFIEGMLNA